MQVRNDLRLIECIYVIHLDVVDTYDVDSSSHRDETDEFLDDFEFFLKSLARLF